MPVCAICEETCDHGNYIEVVLTQESKGSYSVVVCYLCAQLVKATFEAAE